MNIRTTTILSITSLLSFGSLGAQAVLQDSYSAGSPGGAPTQLDGGLGPWGYEINLSGSFSAAGHGKLVMVYSSKDESGNGASSDFGGAPVDFISYDGEELSTAIYNFDEDGVARATIGIYYLDNVLTDGILRIELADEFQSEFGFGLYALDGLKAGVQDTATVAGGGDIVAGAAVTLTNKYGFVVQEAARNNQSLVGDGEPGADGYTTLYSYSAQSYRGLSQYQVVNGGGTGEYFAAINNTGTFKRISGAAFEAVVPEPSSFALLAGMFGFTWIMLRRRS